MSWHVISWITPPDGRVLWRGLWFTSCKSSVFEVEPRQLSVKMKWIWPVTAFERDLSPTRVFFGEKKILAGKPDRLRSRITDAFPCAILPQTVSHVSPQNYYKFYPHSFSFSFFGIKRRKFGRSFAYCSLMDGRWNMPIRSASFIFEKNLNHWAVECQMARWWWIWTMSRENARIPRAAERTGIVLCKQQPLFIVFNTGRGGMF